MLIGIDGNEANVAQKVGIGEYAFQLLTEFSHMQSDTVQFRIYLKDAPRPEMPVVSPHWHYTVFGPKKLWTQVALPMHLFLEKAKPDVFFTPSHYAPRFAPIRTAVSVMDLSYIHFPQLFTKHDLYQLTQWTKYSVNNAKKVFTISHASKNDIINEYQKRADDVIVTHLGIKHAMDKKDISSSQNIREKYGIQRDYILFVGTIQPRKNIARLIEAVAKIVKEKKKEVDLVIVGKKGWLFEDILQTPQQVGIADHVKFLDFLVNEDLPGLYQQALCFVLPSLYEGFGLPVLEAMKNGCPVITSNISSLPEAGGDAAIYVDPENVDDIAAKIEAVISDKKKRSDMIKKGYEQVKKFSWEKTAKETLHVLEEIAKK